MFGPNVIPENDPNDEETTDLRRRARYVLQCKSRIWDRWRKEYLRGLRERHNLTHKGKVNDIKIGDVMMIKGDNKNRANWKLGVVIELISGRDDVIRGAKLKTNNGYLERAVQHLYPMELHCDVNKPNVMVPNAKSNTELNVEAPEFRPKRNPAVVSNIKTNEQLEEEGSEPLVEY